MPGGARARDIHIVEVTHVDGLLRSDAQRLQRGAEDSGIGLLHPGQGGIHDHVEVAAQAGGLSASSTRPSLFETTPRRRPAARSRPSASWVSAAIPLQRWRSACSRSSVPAPPPAGRPARPPHRKARRERRRRAPDRCRAVRSIRSRRARRPRREARPRERHADRSADRLRPSGRSRGTAACCPRRTEPPGGARSISGTEQAGQAVHRAARLGLVHHVDVHAAAAAPPRSRRPRCRSPEPARPHRGIRARSAPAGPSRGSGSRARSRRR